MIRTLFRRAFTASRCCIRTRACCLALPLLSTVVGALPVSVEAQHRPVIAVAASVAGAAQSIARQFHARTAISVRLSVGASGNLARQIRRGAPFELFISADQSYPQAIAKDGLNGGPGTTYATGQLALMVTARSAVQLPSIDDAGETRKAAITRALSDPRIERLAIANPSHAPYGRAARETLQFLGLWSALQAKVVMGESVTQSARFAATDTVQAALLPLGIILHSPLAKERYRIIPASWHAPLHQQMILIKGASAEAQQLFEFMLGDEARAILTKHGFMVPNSPTRRR